MWNWCRHTLPALAQTADAFFSLFRSMDANANRSFFLLSHIQIVKRYARFQRIYSIRMQYIGCEVVWFHHTPPSAALLMKRQYSTIDLSDKFETKISILKWKLTQTTHNAQMQFDIRKCATIKKNWGIKKPISAMIFVACNLDDHSWNWYTQFMDLCIFWWIRPKQPWQMTHSLFPWHTKTEIFYWFSRWFSPSDNKLVVRAYTYTNTKPRHRVTTNQTHCNLHILRINNRLYK